MAVLHNTEANVTYPLGQTAIIGSDPICDIRLMDSKVSLTHAEVHQSQEGSWVLVDLNSENGTFVGGKRISDTTLADGDEVVLATTRLVFKDDRPESMEQFQIEVQTNKEKEDEMSVLRAVQLDPTVGFAPGKDIRDERLLRLNYDKLRIAYELSRTIGMNADLDAVLGQVADTAFRIISADRVAILLSSHPAEEPTVRVARQRSGVAGKVVLSRSLIQKAIRDKQGFVIADACRDARFDRSKSVVSQGIRSAMLVPMVNEDKVLGVMYLDSQKKAGVFDDADLSMFTTIASQASLAIRNAALSVRIQQETRTRVHLQRFLPPSLVERVVRGELEIGTESALRQVTVLFVDIRGFTRLAESLEPSRVFELLNQYFELMVEVLFRHGGTFDKYVGDEVMALFGVPVSLPNATEAAVRCGLEMLTTIWDYNGLRSLSQLPSIEVGIGIHTGEAWCGAIGARRSKQFTAVGNTVNTASRLCALAGPGELLVSEQAFKLVEQDFQAEQVAAVQLKGLTEPVRPFRVLKTIVGRPEEAESLDMSDVSGIETAVTMVSLAPAEEFDEEKTVESEKPVKVHTPVMAKSSERSHQPRRLPLLKSVWMRGGDFLERLNCDIQPNTYFYPFFSGIDTPDGVVPGRLVSLVVQFMDTRHSFHLHAKVRVVHSFGDSDGILLEFLDSEQSRVKKLIASARGEAIHIHHRRFKRYACRLGVRLWNKSGADQKLQSTNIGKGGLFLRTDEPAPLGTLLEMFIEFEQEGPVYFTRGRVVSPIEHGPEPGMSIEFLFDSLAQRNKLIELLDDLVSGSLDVTAEHKVY